jgi:hypothetical protein
MDQPAGLNVNLGAYLHGKEKGTTKVVKLNGVTHYTEKRFDPTNGNPEPVFVRIDASSVAKVREALETQLAAVRALEADLAAAPELMPAEG